MLAAEKGFIYLFALFSRRCIESVLLTAELLAMESARVQEHATRAGTVTVTTVEYGFGDDDHDDDDHNGGEPVKRKRNDIQLTKYVQHFLLPYWRGRCLIERKPAGSKPPPPKKERGPSQPQPAKKKRT